MATAEFAQREYFRELVERISHARHGERSNIIKEAASFLGHSSDWIYAQLKIAGWDSGRKTRADKGNSKFTKQDAVIVSNLIRQSKRDTEKQLLCVGDVVSMAQANGLISTHDISPATVLRMMREYGVHPEQLNKPTTHTSMRSLHPNHVWQFDVSVCVLYYLKNKEGLRVMPEDEFYKNKPHNLERIKKDRVLRYLMTDHYTGAFYVEYFLTPGENQLTLSVFLMNAFTRRDQDDPLHGIPKILIWDLGTANQSHMIKNFLDRLGVKHIPHKQGNSRGKGQVECTHNIVERKFEGRLAFLRINSLEELNTKAHEWMRFYNRSKKHSRHGHSRYALWQTIKEEQLIIAPSREVFQSIQQLTKPKLCKVRGNLVISFAFKSYGSNQYSVESIPDVRVGDSVTVYVNPYRVPNVDVIWQDQEGNEIIYECEPIVKNEAGFDVNAQTFGEGFKTTRDTVTDQERKAMDKEAYGVETTQEVNKRRKKRVPAFEGKIDPFADIQTEAPYQFMPRRGTELPIEAPRLEENPISTIKALKQIKETLGLDSEAMAALNSQFRERYPDGIKQEELQAYTEDLRNGITAEANAG